NPGTVIMEVADLGKMIMKARIDEVAIASVKVGQKAVVRIPAYADREFQGTVTAVALAETTDTTMGGTKYFKAEILLDTKDRKSDKPGTGIMEVADLGKMIMKARIDEVAIASVKVGQKAVVRIPAYADREFQGTVTAVALAETTDTTMGGTKYFKAEILLDT